MQSRRQSHRIEHPEIAPHKCAHLVAIEEAAFRKLIGKIDFESNMMLETFQRYVKLNRDNKHDVNILLCQVHYIPTKYNQLV